ncbi:MAG: hypothetical protein L0G36_05905 [Brevibacterium sp.]|nr:hypothetical protein [Brevibacterium sp.]
MRTQLDVGVFAYSGITDVESHLIPDIEAPGNTENRAAGLNEARSIATAFASPTRRTRNAKAEHLKRCVAMAP